MRVGHKSVALFIVSGLFVSGCSFVEIPPTPQEWGTEAGNYASEEWIKKNGSSNYPTADSIAMYCVNIAEDGQKKYDWTISEGYESTQACVKAFAQRLGLK